MCGGGNPRYTQIFFVAREHVPVTERENRTMKEKGQGMLNVLPLSMLPSRIVIELVHDVIL